MVRLLWVGCYDCWFWLNDLTWFVALVLFLFAFLLRALVLLFVIYCVELIVIVLNAATKFFVRMWLLLFVSLLVYWLCLYYPSVVFKFGFGSLGLCVWFVVFCICIAVICLWVYVNSLLAWGLLWVAFVIVVFTWWLYLVWFGLALFAVWLWRFYCFWFVVLSCAWLRLFCIWLLLVCDLLRAFDLRLDCGV